VSVNVCVCVYVCISVCLYVCITCVFVLMWLCLCLASRTSGLSREQADVGRLKFVAHVTHDSDTTFKVTTTKVMFTYEVGAYCGGIPHSLLLLLLLQLLLQAASYHYQFYYHYYLCILSSSSQQLVLQTRVVQAVLYQCSVQVEQLGASEASSCISSVVLLTELKLLVYTASPDVNVHDMRCEY